MVEVGPILTTAPAEYKTPLERMTYQALEALHIPFQRVETSEVITMEDCAAVNAALDMDMVKTLFLCNRQQTAYYLFITRGDKPFRAKDFSAALGVARLSFAPAEQMEAMLGTKIGAATVFSALLPSARDVTFVFDREVLAAPWYGCSDGTTTGYLKLETERVFRDFMAHTGHVPVQVP